MILALISHNSSTTVYVERQFFNFFFHFFLELQNRLEGNDISFPLQRSPRSLFENSAPYSPHFRSSHRRLFSRRLASSVVRRPSLSDFCSLSGILVRICSYACFSVVSFVFLFGCLSRDNLWL